MGGQDEDQREFLPLTPAVLEILPLGGATAPAGLDPGSRRAARPRSRRRAPTLLPADRPGA